MVKKLLGILLAFGMILNVNSICVSADEAAPASWSDGGFLWQYNYANFMYGDYPVVGRYLNFQTGLTESSLTLRDYNDDSKMVFAAGANIPEKSIVYKNEKDAEGNYTTVLNEFTIDKENGVLQDNGENKRAMRFESFGQFAFLMLSDLGLNNAEKKNTERTVGIRFSARGETDGTTVEWVSSGNPSGEERALTTEYKEYTFVKTFKSGDTVRSWFDVNRGHAAYFRDIEVRELAAPTVAAAEYDSGNGTVLITFSSDMDDSALNINNYSVSDAIIGKVEKVSGKQYRLSFAKPISKGGHTVKVKGVSDKYGIPMNEEYIGVIEADTEIVLATAWDSNNGLAGQNNYVNYMLGDYPVVGRYLNFQSNLWASSLTIRKYDDDSMYVFDENATAPEKSIVYKNEKTDGEYKTIIDEKIIAPEKVFKASYTDKRALRYEPFDSYAFLNLPDISLNSEQFSGRTRTVGIKFSARGETDGTTIEWLSNGQRNGNEVSLTTDYKKYTFAKTFAGGESFLNYFAVNTGHAVYLKDIEICELTDPVVTDVASENGALTVTYNNNMNESALNAANYAVSDATISSVVKADGNKYRLEFAYPISKGTHTVSISGVSDEFNQPMAYTYSGTVNVEASVSQTKQIMSLDMSGRYNWKKGTMFGEENVQGRYWNAFQSDLYNSFCNVMSREDDSKYMFNTSEEDIPDKMYDRTITEGREINAADVLNGANDSMERVFRFEPHNDSAGLLFSPGVEYRNTPRKILIKFEARKPVGADETKLQWKGTGESVTLTSEYKQYTMIHDSHVFDDTYEGSSVKLITGKDKVFYIGNFSIYEVVDTVLVESTPNYGEAIGECDGVTLTFNNNIDSSENSINNILENCLLNGESADIDNVIIDGNKVTIKFMESLPYGTYILNADGIKDEFGIAVSAAAVKFTVTTDKIIFDAKRLSAGKTVGAKVLNYTNSGDEKITPVLLIALYKDGCLKELVKNTAELEAGGTAESIDISVKLPESLDDGVYTAKAFFWDGLGSMKPIKESVSIAE